MNLLNFVIQILNTQGKTLQRLAAFFGEEELLQMLETAGETLNPVILPFNLGDLLDSPLDGSAASQGTNTYAQLEGAVHEMKLPAVLEFHLWAYPFYRAIIESPFDLGSPIRNFNNTGGNRLVIEALKQAEEWVKNLPIHPEVSAQAERAAMIPWLRFRSEILKKFGKRPFISL